MAITVYEATDSRRFTQDRNGGGLTARFIAGPSSDEQAVRAAVVLDTTVSYWGTLFRSAIRLDHRGGGYWNCEVDYAPIPPGEAIQTPGFEPGAGAGGDQPAPAAPDPGAPLGPGFRLSTVGGTTKIYQNLKTVKIQRSLAAIAAGRGERDHYGAINVTDDNGAEGLDIVSRTGEWSIDVRRPTVTLNYFKQLFFTTGCVNSELFWGFDPGELLYLGAELQYTAPVWSVSHKFAYEPNRNNLVVSEDANGVPQITIPGLKEGWDYVEVSYYPDLAPPAGGGPNVKVMRPEQAVVHRVYRRTNFDRLEIGS